MKKWYAKHRRGAESTPLLLRTLNGLTKKIIIKHFFYK